MIECFEFFSLLLQSTGRHSDGVGRVTAASHSANVSKRNKACTSDCADQNNAGSPHDPLLRCHGILPTLLRDGDRIGL